KLNQALQGLQDARRDWHHLRNEEDERNRQTVRALDHVDLGKLHDPGLLDRVAKFLEPFVKFATDVALGNWDQALWDLHDSLHELSNLLSSLQFVIMALIAVVAVVALLTGVGAVAIPFLVQAFILVNRIQFAVDATRAAVDVGLLARGKENERTHQRM